MATGSALDAAASALLFQDLTTPFAIAVSGGSDSIGLMHLIAEWRACSDRARELPPPIILTVDHGLRPESAAEAIFVGSQATALGFTHETLQWHAPKPVSGVQAAARDARYDLLQGRLAADNMPRVLLLAHTLEDQAETILMRLARGSGIDGLSAMRTVETRTVVLLRHPVREIALTLRRPLLGTSKAAIQAFLRNRSVSWCEDPSNTDVRFERIRVRAAAPALATLGLTAESLGRSARRLGDARAVLHQHNAKLAAVSINDHNGAFGELIVETKAGALQVTEVVHLLSPLLDVFGGAALPAQLSQIETLAERVCSTSDAGIGRLTLGGCLIEIIPGVEERRVRVFREHSRGSLPTCRVEPGQGIFWDRRFYISVAPTAAASIEIGAYGAEPIAPSAAKLPRSSLAGLPSWRVNGAAEAQLLRPGNHEEISCQWPPQHARRLRWLEPAEQISQIR